MKNHALSGLTPDILEIALEMQGWKGRIMGRFSVHFSNKGEIIDVQKLIICKVKERKKREKNRR